MIIAIAVSGDGTPAAGGTLVEAGAVDDAVLHGRRPHNRQLVGAAAALVVDAADAEEGLVRVGHAKARVVGGRAGLAFGEGGGCRG